MSNRKRHDKAPAAVNVEPDLGADIGLRDIKDANGLVIRGATVVQACWRDPEDDNPNRRKPRMVEGARQVSPLYQTYVRALGARDEEAPACGAAVHRRLRAR
jgi:hypothetical protein